VTDASPPGGELRRRLRTGARAIALYALVSVAVTYPYALKLHVMEPGDAAFFAWELGWTLHALTSDPGQLAHANIYHPERYALGMDEPILGSSILMLPLWPFTQDAVLLLNLLRFLLYVLCAFHTYLLARELDCGEGPALVAGAAFAFSPIRVDQVGHLSTLGAQWLPLVLLYLHRFARTGLWRHSLALGICYALAGYACGYHGMIGAVVLPVAAAPLFWGRWSRLPGLALAGALAGSLLLPLYHLHQMAFRAHGFARGRDEAVLYSAPLERFLATSDWNLIWGSVTEPFRGPGGGLFPGLTLLVLVALGAYGCWRRRIRPSRIALGMGGLAVAAALVALGPEVRIGEVTLMPGPFGLLREWIGPFRMIRVTTRAGVFLALALAVLAALALRRYAGRRWVVAGVGALIVAEGWIAPIPIASWAEVVDTRSPPPPVYTWLAEQPGDFAIAELPIVPNDGEFRRPAFHESIYMVYSTLHWKRLVNGYAGVEPQRYRVIRDLTRRFPSRDSLDALRGAGVRYVILHRDGFGPNKSARLERELPRYAEELVEVVRFGPDSVLELRPGQ
jgi:hypothetical protein